MIFEEWRDEVCVGSGRHGEYDIFLIEGIDFPFYLESSRYLWDIQKEEIDKLEAREKKLKECINELWEKEPGTTEMLDILQPIIKELYDE